MEITQVAAATILTEASRAGRRECCGLLTGPSGGPVRKAVPAANVHARPDRNFEIDPAALFAAQRSARAGGPALIGYYHSHPSGDIRPSIEDARRAAPDGRLWIITDGRRLKAFVADGTGIETRFRPITLTILSGS